MNIIIISQFFKIKFRIQIYQLKITTLGNIILESINYLIGTIIITQSLFIITIR